MSDLRTKLPKDSEGDSIDRAMSVPVVRDTIILGSATKYADVFDLSSYSGRVFHGISIDNPGAIALDIAITDAFGVDRAIVVPAARSVFYDNQSFGAGFHDIYLNKKTSRVRAKLQSTSGTLASGTIIYVGNPTNGMTVDINSITYEFSSDMSVIEGRVKVDIGVDADASYTNLAAAITANDQALTGSIDTGTNTVTITSNYGGTYGNQFAMADGSVPTGATFSGATLSGGAGGITPVFHIW